jgi:hypothetical protein
MKNMVIYQAPSGAIEFRSDKSKETVWASLDQIAEVFGRDKSVISRHLRNIFSERDSLIEKQLLQKLQQFKVRELGR